jgi:hypothetical protein
MIDNDPAIRGRQRGINVVRCAEQLPCWSRATSAASAEKRRLGVVDQTTAAQLVADCPPAMSAPDRRSQKSDAHPLCDSRLTPVLRLTVIDPWKALAGIWSENTPEWVRILGTIAATAHGKYDPFGRRPTPS